MRARFRLAIAAIGLLTLVPGAVRADVIPPGQRSVQYCFEIANAAAFPDYVLVAALIPSGHQVITGGECTGLYRGATIYAMKRSDYNPAAIPQEGQAQRAFFASSPQVIRPGVQVNALRTVAQGDPRTAVADVLTIAALTDTALDLGFTGVRYTFNNGTTQEIPYQEQGQRPEPSAVAPVAQLTSRAISFAWFALLPLAALIAIGAIIILRRRA